MVAVCEADVILYGFWSRHAPPPLWRSPTTADSRLPLGMWLAEECPRRLEDQRTRCIDLIRAAERRYALNPPDVQVLWQTADQAERELFRLRALGPGLHLLYSRGRKTEAAEQKVQLYVHNDSLVLHLGLSRSGVASAIQAWDETNAELLDLIREAQWPERPTGANWWGVTRVRRALVKGHRGPPDEVEPRPDILAAMQRRPSARLRVGRLWLRSNRFREREYWAVVPAEHEGAANQLMFWWPRDIAWFPQLELSRHKIAFEIEAYDAAKQAFAEPFARLNHRVRWFVSFQRAHDRALAVGGSPEARELVEKLARTTAENADLVRTLTWMDEITNTVRINLQNLIRAVDALQMPRDADDLFADEQAAAERNLAQMEADRVYHRSLAERAAAGVAMAASRMQVGLAHHTREQVALQGIQASLIGSFGAAVALFHFRNAVPFLYDLSPTRLTGLMLAWIATVFSICQAAINWNREKQALDRWAVAIAVGLWTLWGVGWVPFPASYVWRTAIGLLLFAPAVGAGYFAFLIIETRPRGPKSLGGDFHPSGPTEESLPEDELKRKLEIARRELPDLLEDLPAPTVFRIKSEDSAAEKLARKRQPVSYLGDTIGIRYVVPPFLMPRYVWRVMSILNFHEVDCRIGDYRAVHIGVTLHGQGRDPALDLKAEIQIKTRLQDWQATWNWGHGYKNRPHPAWWERAVNRALVWLCAAEARVFRRWLTVPVGPRSGVVAPAEQQSAAPEEAASGEQ